LRVVSDFFDEFASDGSVTTGLTLSGPAIQPGIFGSGLTQVLYLTEPGDTADMSMNDIHQGQIGDCFLLGSIGELAALHPDLIRRMIGINTDGTETVTLYLGQNGSLASLGTSSYLVTSTIVTNDFPGDAVNNGSTQDVVGSLKEIWVQVIEKAVAQLAGGYAGIANGGNPALAMQELTGHAAAIYSPSSMTADILQQLSSAGALVTFDTKSSGLGYNLIGNHCYMFKSVVNTADGPAVVLANPWGMDQPDLVPLSQLAANFVEVDICQLPASRVTPPSQTAQVLPDGKLGVYRFFDTIHGTQFLTGSVNEANSAIANRPDLTYEGIGLAGIAAGANDPNAVPVYRFFDTRNGTHFFTANHAEEASLAATRSDLVLESTSFYEHATQQAGDTAVYRFFNSNDGTHFFTQSSSERASIAATRPDMAFEGVAFYAPTPS
ncbi:MAG: C2 family cysteine protease, partial [Acetobacteraceae bacterium]|nr:C2 family cysteine protease [Acetobacteraceae bacterium]